MRDAAPRVGPAAAVSREGRPATLRISGVKKRFGGVAALDGVEMDVPAGAVVGLIGPNGAGKSTLFNVVTGIVPADRGRVVLDGVDVTGRSMQEMARLGVGRTFQTPRGFGSMTVLENLLVAAKGRGERLLHAFAAGRGVDREVRDRAHAVVERIGLSGLANLRYESLSVGQARLLEIGRHLMRDVGLLLLDEPTAGVVPSMQESLRDLLLELNGQGVTVVIVEHNLGFVLPLVSTVFVMDLGRVIAVGPPAEIQGNPDVIAAYLGGSGA